MRKWHRWLSVFFAIVMLWIAITGVLSQVAALWPAGEAAAVAPPPGFECPQGWRCMPPPSEGGGIRAMTGLFHHLHSGETFGPLGTAVSILSGFALIFFSISGIWLYVQMWRLRRRRALAPRWFWK